MKAALIISSFSAAILGGLIFFAMRDAVDRPTQMSTAAGALDRVRPAEVPNMLEHANPDEDATPLYQEAAAFYVEHLSKLRQDNPDAQLAEQFTQKMIEAMEAGKIENGFLDEFVGISLGENFKKTEALAWMGKTIAKHSELYEDVDQRKAAVRAIWTFGVRLVEQSDLFEVRVAGISNITSAWHELNILYPGEAEFAPYQEYTGAIEDAKSLWERKWKAITKQKNRDIGDLLRFAEHDRDPAFRVMAIQQLGLVRFDPQSKANLNATNALLVRLQDDAHPLVARAAKAAAELTLEDLRQIRG